MTARSTPGVVVTTALVVLLSSCVQPPAGAGDQGDAAVGADAALVSSDGSVDAAAPEGPCVREENQGEQGERSTRAAGAPRRGHSAEGGSEEIQISGMMLVLVLLLGAMVYIVMRWTRTKMKRLAISKPRRALFNRARPLVEAVVTVLYVVVSVRLIFSGNTLFTTIVLGLFTLGFIWVSWFAIRDVVAGMLIKASEVCLPGDYIEVGGVVGHVRGLGYRLIALDTLDGGQAFIPYSKVSRETLVRKPVTDGVYRHTFVVKLDADVEVVEAKDAIRRYALNSHWHSVVREPQIEVDEENAFTVTVFAIADNQGHRIEASVRAALLASPPRSALQEVLVGETRPRLPRSQE